MPRSAPRAGGQHGPVPVYAGRHGLDHPRFVDTGK